MATVTKYPSAVAAAGGAFNGAWTGAVSAVQSDNAVYMTAAPGKNQEFASMFHVPFSTADIPEGSAITSVLVEAQVKCSTTASIGIATASLFADQAQAAPIGAVPGVQSPATEPLVDTTYSFTRNPTEAEVRDLWVRVQGTRGNNNTALTWSLDFVRVTVTYTLPPPPEVHGTTSALVAGASIGTTASTSRSAASAISAGASIATTAERVEEEPLEEHTTTSALGAAVTISTTVGTARSRPSSLGAVASLATTSASRRQTASTLAATGLIASLPATARSSASGLAAAASTDHGSAQTQRSQASRLSAAARASLAGVDTHRAPLSVLTALGAIATAVTPGDAGLEQRVAPSRLAAAASIATTHASSRSRSSGLAATALVTQIAVAVFEAPPPASQPVREKGYIKRGTPAADIAAEARERGLPRGNMAAEVSELSARALDERDLGMATALEEAAVTLAEEYHVPRYGRVRRVKRWHRLQ